MHRIFISDLHLDAIDSPAALRFAELLHIESQRADEIMILGDLVEMWIGDDDESELAQWLSKQLRQAAQQCKVSILHGNRDFLFGEDFAVLANVTLLDLTHLTEDGTLVCHGDHLCTDDKEYQVKRLEALDPTWQANILAMKLEDRQALGLAMRSQSKINNANKAANIMDVNTQAAQEFVSEMGSTLLVHGHTHRPGIHKESTYTRVVLGAWEQCGWLARQTDKQLSLECFTLAGRYGT